MDSLVYRPLPETPEIIASSRQHAREGSFTSPYAAKAEGHLRGNDRRFTRSVHKIQVKSLVAAFASVTAIIFLILICRSVRSRAHSGVVTRKLSSDGNLSDSGSDDVVICEGPGEEGTEDAAEPSPQVPLTPPKAKKAKVEADESGAHVEEESESDEDEPSTSSGRKRKRKHQAPSAEAPSDEGSASPRRSEEELEAANALLDLQQSLMAAGELSPRAGESPAASVPSDAPVHSPTSSAGASQMSAAAFLQMLLQPSKLVLPPVKAFVPPEVAAPIPAATVVAEGTGDSVASTSPADGEEPSTSSAEGESAESPGPPVHPYYRIPRVDPALKAVRRFRPELTTDFSIAFSKTCPQLRRMRALLNKPTLGSIELDELAQKTAELLSYTYFYERASTARECPSSAARHLGRRYMLLDSAIAALQVLGEPACGEWWDRIVSVIPDDTPEDPAAYTPARLNEAAYFNMHLVKRLHSALRVLKTGKRLSKEKTIVLKRDLFCLSYSPANFRESRWDPWREDDKDSRATS